MAGDKKLKASAASKEKASSAPKDKASPAAKEEASPAAKEKAKAPAKTESASDSDVSTPKAEGGETADAAPSGYSRGEGQKPVSNAYRENWAAIFAKKKKR